MNLDILTMRRDFIHFVKSHYTNCPSDCDFRFIVKYSPLFCTYGYSRYQLMATQNLEKTQDLSLFRIVDKTEPWFAWVRTTEYTGSNRDWLYVHTPEMSFLRGACSRCEKVIPCPCMKNRLNNQEVSLIPGTN